ncbi:MAG: phosphate ABC transporter substrate-binding protein [Gammaproteobacteria bacterium]|jgi:phosphate transport system substrate-binding protein|nr:phosphate ABC transporter substrate-binding protein [Gammaproteobacteria bacterium]MBT7603633.1 phosphate ABC transporter substrate-binding protein [Gammaproteobacteria bacterium]
MLKNILRFILLITTISPSTQARDQINIVGSSTVYPFAIVVAEKFGKTTEFKTPKIESTGSGGGLKLFCAGVGTRHPDFTNSSRAIKENEIKKCRKNSVGDITEVKVGYDGVVIANAKSSKIFKMTRMDLYLALAAEIPNPDGSETFIKNPHKTWKDVNPELPTIKIEVLGPPPTSGTRDAFVELAMEKGGCKKIKWIKALKKNNKQEYKAKCHTIREDGPYIEAGENDNLMIQKLISNPKALAIFGFSFLDQNTDKVQGAIINGIKPTFENISSGKYPVSRPLFFYVKNAHLETIPGMKEYVDIFLSDAASGNDGYLTEKGLIPMPKKERAELNPKVLNYTLIVGDKSPSIVKEK